MSKDFITVTGARQHNLKNISLSIPKNKLVVFTGLSGSGKSSLAFDTIYAEGQRRYVESLSSYARQFLGIMTKPDVDQIDGLSPSISINQKTTNHNPRSTVGTITEVYDYLRLLFARVGHPHCPNCGEEIETQSAEQISNKIISTIEDYLRAEPIARFFIQSPVVRDKKGEFSGLLGNLRKKGFQKVRIDGRVFDLDEEINLLKTNRHTISAVVERFSIGKKQINDDVMKSSLKSRVNQAVETALDLSKGLVVTAIIKDKSLEFPQSPTDFTDHLFSESFACPKCNISLAEIEPRIFSFNSPHGACSTCNGLGSINKVDPMKIIAEELTISEGAVIPFANMLSKDTWFSRKIAAVFSHHKTNMKTEWRHLPKDFQKILLYGDKTVYTISGTNKQGRIATFQDTFEGVVTNLERRHLETNSDFMRGEIEKYMKKEICHSCKGTRLKDTSLSITIKDLNISQLTNLPIKDAHLFIMSLKKDLSDKERQIGELIIKEVISRLHFLVSVGLDYLTLSREAATLAGGEAQRIRLASQIGTGLTGVLYVLDEPSIGLHHRDNNRLIDTLKHLRDIGNTVLVVEHDEEIMKQSDHIVDFGPLAGKLGGELVAQGTFKQIKSNSKSLTGKYLSGKKKVDIPTNQKLSNPNTLTLVEAKKHNLKNISVTFPLGNFIVITGVSGSGKSTLMHDVLYEASKDYLNYQKPQTNAPYKSLKGYEHLDRVSLIDQSPIGKTPRSNPATYTKVFDYIRKLMTNTQEAKIRGYKAGRFSFNVKGGRCEACQGEGQVKIEMQFMPDVYITCDLCHGARYNSETLEVKYKGKNISQILDFTIDEAAEFFHTNKTLQTKLVTLKDVGLGYITLGQPAPTLSGGEAQRVKLAKELSIRSPGQSLYLLDEPTTGLHFEDIKNLLVVLKRLVEQGNTVVVIEHNLDVIKNADHIIDLGPEGGDEGGEVLVTGTPSQIAKHKSSYTGAFLKKALK